MDTSAVTIVPAGSGGKARVILASGRYGPANADAEDCARQAKAISAAWKRTSRGYTMDVRVPWSILRGYYSGWKTMPVDAAVNTAGPDGRVQLIMNKLGDPMMEPFIYAGLVAK